MFLALDTDILAYRSATSAETEIEWEPDIWTLYMDLNDAKKAFTSQLDNIKNELKVSKVVCCLTDKHNFRRDVHPEYKANRKGTRKPVGYTALLDWIRDNFETFQKPGLEADDCMGLLATMPQNKGKCIIVSDDKDMLSIPGQLYRPFQRKLITVSEQDADKQFYLQTLCGDATDNYKGLPGVGPKKAEAILGPRPLWGAVEQAFIKAGHTRDDAIQQARLARILRWSDWDNDKGEIKLWTPKQ